MHKNRFQATRHRLGLPNELLRLYPSMPRLNGMLAPLSSTSHLGVARQRSFTDPFGAASVLEIREDSVNGRPCHAASQGPSSRTLEQRQQSRSDVNLM
ncbi:hypothetical protein HPB47_022658 [Ixodes persulcatus]|uniref:Uncharacterized protein n=1 Tax=Ixodes persulcatus TaxID=34615 RepID=A0AC60QBC4_IXOPE|nr:hypothetical protein HPB47_022658 [Ixodes persulcatus]